MIWNAIKKPFVAVWNYLKPSWEGDDGKVSYRRASQFVFLTLIVMMVVRNNLSQKWEFYAFLILCLTFLLLAMVISADQIIKGIRGIASFKQVVTEEVTEDEDTTKKTTTVETTVPPKKAAGEEGG